MLDLARGSTLVSLWGDLWLLEEDDVELLAGALALLRETDVGFRDTVAIGGDPWRGEPYGYAQPLADGRLVTVSNPGFEPRSLALDLGPLWEIYPSPGFVAGGELQLLPWEVRVLRTASAGEPVRESPRPRPTTVLAHGSTLPDLADGDRVVVWTRLTRGGAWRYDPEPQSLFRLELAVDGEPVETTRAPSIRSWNGPGCPWVTYSAPARPEWSGRELSVGLSAELPAGYEAESGVLVYDGRAVERPRRIALRPVPAPTTPASR
jgi:hypothetical protein